MQLQMFASRRACCIFNRILAAISKISLENQGCATLQYILSQKILEPNRKPSVKSGNCIMVPNTPSWRFCQSLYLFKPHRKSGLKRAVCAPQPRNFTELEAFCEESMKSPQRRSVRLLGGYKKLLQAVILARGVVLPCTNYAEWPKFIFLFIL